MKALFAFLIAASFLGIAKSQDCKCYPDQTVSAVAGSVTIGPPTTSGGYVPPCAPTVPSPCTTTVNFTGTLSNGLPAGAQISIVQCVNLTDTNNVTLLANGQVFNSCPAGTHIFNIVNTNVFTFVYRISVPITFTVNLAPIPQVPQTTTTPAPPTTPAYAGPFAPNNPALSRMDLVIGVDSNEANHKYFDQIRQVAMGMLQYFTFSPDYVRVSFMGFDPLGVIGGGQYPLWSHTLETMNKTLSALAVFPGNNSKYFSVLQNKFFNMVAQPVFNFRNNTQRVFIIFTGTDGSADDDAIVQAVNDNIDANDIKFIFVNMNTGVLTQTAGPQNAYPNIAKLTGTNSNKAHWFDYKLNQNNSENILNTFYFDGNALCNTNLAHPGPLSLVTTSDSVLYSVPWIKDLTTFDFSKFYCNYMNDALTYTNDDPTPNSDSTLQVHIINYEIANGKDYIRISADGNEVSVLTGLYGGAYYCLDKAKNVTVTFQSREGLIYNGYKSKVSLFNTYGDCFTNLVGSRSTFIDVTNNRH